MTMVARFDAGDFRGTDPAMIQSWQRDGFLLLENFFTTDACDELRARAVQLVADADVKSISSVFSTTSHQHTRDIYFQTSGDKIRFFLEDGALDAAGELRVAPELAVNKIGHALHDLDPVFDAFSRTDQLARLAGDLGVAEPLLLQSMYIFKSPGIGGEVSCHQDSTFLYTEPLSCIGFWVALEDATIENGCMFALAGEHKGPLVQRFLREANELKFTPAAEVQWQSAAVPLEAPKGSLVVLHGKLPHYSAANTSPDSRHAYTLHVIDGACLYLPDNWLQRGATMPLRGFQ